MIYCSEQSVWVAAHAMHNSSTVMLRTLGSMLRQADWHRRLSESEDHPSQLACVQACFKLDRGCVPWHCVAVCVGVV